MDGITFLRKLMAQKPIPVVMCSSLMVAGSETLMQSTSIVFGMLKEAIARCRAHGLPAWSNCP